MFRRQIAFGLILGLTACGGGGGGGTSGGGGGGNIPSATTVALSVLVPSVGPSETKRPAYVGTGTNTLIAKVNGVPIPPASIASSFNAGTYTFTFAVGAGNDAFDLTLANGSTQGSHGTVTAQIAPGTTTTLHLTFHGIVASGSIVSDNQYPSVGVPAVEHLTLRAFDALGNQIIGDDYDSAISITSDDASGHTSLGGTVFRNPSDVLALNYDGHLVSVPIDITIANAGVTTVTPFVTLPNPYTTYGPLSGLAFNVAAGANGSMWFVGCAQYGGPCNPGYVDSTGSVHEFAQLPDLANATLGPDGNEWYTGGAQPFLYRVTPAGVETAFRVRTLLPSEAYDSTAIVTGPDGNLWFDEGDKIGTMTPTGTATEYTLDALYRPKSIIVGPDNRLWFDNGPEIGAIATNGTRTYYPITGANQTTRLIFGFGGLLYFNQDGFNGTYQTMTTSGVQSTFAAPLIGGSGWPVFGPGGAIWDVMTKGTAQAPFWRGLGFINSSGVATYYPFNPNQSQLAFGLGLAASTDGNLWSAGNNSSYGFPSNGITRFRNYP